MPTARARRATDDLAKPQPQDRQIGQRPNGRAQGQPGRPQTTVGQAVEQEIGRHRSHRGEHGNARPVNGKESWRQDLHQAVGQHTQHVRLHDGHRGRSVGRHELAALEEQLDHRPGQNDQPHCTGQGQQPYAARPLGHARLQGLTIAAGRFLRGPRRGHGGQRHAKEPDRQVEQAKSVLQVGERP